MEVFFKYFENSTLNLILFFFNTSVSNFFTIYILEYFGLSIVHESTDSWKIFGFPSNGRRYIQSASTTLVKVGKIFALEILFEKYLIFLHLAHNHKNPAVSLMFLQIGCIIHVNMSATWKVHRSTLLSAFTIHASKSKFFLQFYQRRLYVCCELPKLALK